AEAAVRSPHYAFICADCLRMEIARLGNARDMCAVLARGATEKVQRWCRYPALRVRKPKVRSSWGTIVDPRQRDKHDPAWLVAILGLAPGEAGAQALGHAGSLVRVAEGVDQPVQIHSDPA